MLDIMVPNGDEEKRKTKVGEQSRNTRKVVVACKVRAWACSYPTSGDSGAIDPATLSHAGLLNPTERFLVQPASKDEMQSNFCALHRIQTMFPRMKFRGQLTVNENM